MLPTPEERREILAACTKFLPGHYPKSVEQQLRQIAESSYAKLPRDHYGSGGFVNQFEQEVASLLGKEAAVFMPSGTMAQQIALRLWCDRAENKRVAFHPTCHLQIHEQMAYRELHGMSALLVGRPDALFTLEDLKGLPEKPAALLIELPQREIGGQLPSWSELQEILDWCRANGVKAHLDGARLWECIDFYSRPYANIVEDFDTVYVSFYKILGGLPGAMLAGPAEFIAEAKIWQRRHGGNLYQSAPNAISAKLGMDRHLPKIGTYCAKAYEIARALTGVPGIRVNPEHPPTNMMHLFLTGDKEAMETEMWRIAREQKVFVMGALQPTENPREQKLELSIGEAALDLEESEVAQLFAHIVENG